MEKDQQDSDNWMEIHQNRFTYQPELAQNPINLSGADGEILVYLNVFPQINFTSQPSVMCCIKNSVHHTQTLLGMRAPSSRTRRKHMRTAPAPRGPWYKGTQSNNQEQQRVTPCFASSQQPKRKGQAADETGSCCPPSLQYLVL